MSLVRYILAFGVLISHFNVLCGASVPWIVTNHDRVGGFFALSGFLLVSPLLKGTGYKEFVARRAWRILPSYLFVVMGFALGLCCLSQLTPVEYFSSKGFWEYVVVNILSLNFLHPDLPGVFSNLEIPAVNGALWTMKVEWQLSLTVPLVIWFIKRYSLNLRKSILVILFISLFYRLIFFVLYHQTGSEIYEILGRQFVGQTIYFYGGILVFTYYEELNRNKVYFALGTVVLYIIFRISDFNTAYFILLHPFIITLLVLSFSILPHNVAAYIDRGNNISYEIYLCHFPIMQILAEFKFVEKYGVILSLTIGIILTLIAAIITYFCVGKIYLSHRGKPKSTYLVK